MAVGYIVASIVIAIIAIIMIKLYRNTSKTSYFGETNRCQNCGRKKHTPTCPFCKSDSKQLR